MGSNNRDDPQMPKVGQIIEPHTTVAARFRVLHAIYSGPFSDVFLLGKDGNLSEKYAMKVERQIGNIRPVLKLDVYVLREMNGKAGFPKFIGAGQTSYYKYCIMELLGPDLSKLRRSLHDKRHARWDGSRGRAQVLDVDLAARLPADAVPARGAARPGPAVPRREGAQLRDRPRRQRAHHLHAGLWLRAQVPVRALLGRRANAECCCSDKQGVLLKPRPAAALMGTFIYAPMASHNREEQCRRDDLESWFYMAWELLKGSLPWCHLYGVERHQLVLEWKQFVRGPGRSIFLDGLPPQFDKILDAIDAIGFFERPDYRFLAAQITMAAENLYVNMNEPFDWETNNYIVRKAKYVGDVGESDMASDLLKQNASDLETATDVTPVDVET